MKKARIFAAALAVSLCATNVASADVLEFRIVYEFSGATSPAGNLPWLIVTIDDGGTLGSVDLTLEASNLVDNEFVSGWYLNLAPSLDPNKLLFSEPTKYGSFETPSISLGENDFMADGDGNFDILFGFKTSEASRFGVGEKIEYTITGISTLMASSFDFLSDSGERTGWPTAAHVQSIGAKGDSGWVTVPEPATLSIMVAAGLPILLKRRRSRR